MKIKNEKCEFSNKIELSEECIGKLFLHMSTARSNKYLSAANQDVFAALRLYQLNGEAGAKLWVPMQHLEIALRNTIDKALCQAFSGEWLGNTAFYRTMKQHKCARLKELVEKHSNKQTKTVNRGKVIADLSLSFWEDMLLPKFVDIFWMKCADDAFPNRDKDQEIREFIDLLHGQLKMLRYLRNRIAHHEPIFLRRIHQDWEAIINITRCCSWEFYQLTLPYQELIEETSKEITALLAQKDKAKN